MTLKKIFLTIALFTCNLASADWTHKPHVPPKKCGVQAVVKHLKGPAETDHTHKGKGQDEGLAHRHMVVEVIETHRRGVVQGCGDFLNDPIKEIRLDDTSTDRLNGVNVGDYLFASYNFQNYPIHKEIWAWEPERYPKTTIWASLFGNVGSGISDSNGDVSFGGQYSYDGRGAVYIDDSLFVLELFQKDSSQPSLKLTAHLLDNPHLSTCKSVIYKGTTRFYEKGKIITRTIEVTDWSVNTCGIQTRQTTIWWRDVDGDKKKFREMRLSAKKLEFLNQ